MKTIINAFLAVIFTSLSVAGQVVEPIGKDKVANGGYDFVAYFTDNAAVKGKKEFTQEMNGVKYQFTNAEHRDLFKGNPEKYLPVCDGYCAWGVAEKGKRVPVDPKTFKIIDGKLHLFFNGDFNGSAFNTLPEWNKNEMNLLKELPVKWAALKK